MRSFNGLGFGLSMVFGCLLLAFVAELYYLLWWKKKRRMINTEIEDEYNSYTKELVHLLCWKKSSSWQTSTTNNNINGGNNNSNQELLMNPDGNCHERDLELGSSKDFLLKAFGEEGVEAELMRLHNLAGPPRFLFTIKEETNEDLESDDGKSRGERSTTRSLSDLVMAVDSPFLTPLASPHLKSPPLNSLDTFHLHGLFNPLFESSGDGDSFSRFRSSPPPKFKFLRDAEEKLLRRLAEEAEKKRSSNGGKLVQDSGNKASNDSTMAVEEMEGSFLKFIVKNNREKDHNRHQNLPQFPSCSSQVLPLASSPTTFRPLNQKPSVH